MQIGNFNLPTIWTQIKGYPNYQISICGQVKNVKTIKIEANKYFNSWMIIASGSNNLFLILSIVTIPALIFIS